MNPLIQFKTTPPLLITLALLCFGLSPTAKALLPAPAPDGGYPGGNTAEGINALHDVNTALGINNTAVGTNALTHDTTGNYNVAVGEAALANNTTGNFNMAIGTEALRDNNSNFNLAIGFRVGFMNTTGNHLTGIGAAALRNNTTASDNTAVGADAMRENTTGEANTAIGADALAQNTTGSANTAIGDRALPNNTEGHTNIAIGFFALLSNTIGNDNTAIGVDALVENTAGQSNTAIGFEALDATTGSGNTAIGTIAGGSLHTGDGNVYIGDGITGFDPESNHTYIRNIDTTTVSGGNSDAVTIDLNTGLLGHLSSSRRYKENVKPMDNASEALYRLKPVTYRYKKEIDRTQGLDYGLIAEDVANVDPSLAIRDRKGQIESVRYTAVNAMLLNEFLKEHRKVEQLERQVAALTAGLQKVSAQIETSKPAPQVVNNP